MTILGNNHSVMPHPMSVPVTDGVITGVVLDADIVLGRTGSDGVAGVLLLVLVLGMVLWVLL